MPRTLTKRRNVKAEALKLVRSMPDSSSWDDLMYRIYVRQKIEAGLGDIQAKRTHAHDAIRREFALS